jgi:hypothetical protein
MANRVFVDHISNNRTPRLNDSWFLGVFDPPLHKFWSDKRRKTKFNNDPSSSQVLVTVMESQPHNKCVSPIQVVTVSINTTTGLVLPL